MGKKRRCFGDGVGKEFYADYHDREWGVALYDEKRLFEMLILEGAQAGLSWEIVLRKREGYREAFLGFDPNRVARMRDEELEILTSSSKIIANRRKIFSARQNARVFLKIQEEFGSFSRYVWDFVGGRPIVNHWHSLKEVPCRSPKSIALSKELKRRGMGFVGEKIMYSFMQAVGMVDDHLESCFRKNPILETPL